MRLLCWYATPPVFDGPEDRNGRRNHDEAAFWLRLLAGELTWPPPEGPFVLLGQSNLDPVDGEGLRGAMDALLDHPALQDPAPRGSANRREPKQRGDPDHAGGRRQQEAMHTRQNGLNRLQLGRSKAAPAQRIHDVILKRRVKFFEFDHSSMSSTPTAPAAARSLAVISFSTSVSL